jgi:hypothetical protein
VIANLRVPVRIAKKTVAVSVAKHFIFSSALPFPSAAALARYRSMAAKSPALKLGQSHRRRPKWILGLVVLVLYALVLPARGEDRFRPVRGQLKPYVADSDLALIGDQSSEESLKGEGVTPATPFAGCLLAYRTSSCLPTQTPSSDLEDNEKEAAMKTLLSQDIQNQGQGVDAIGWTLMTGLNKIREGVHNIVTRTPYPSRRKASRPDL